MRVRLTVTLDVDEEAWASEYGVGQLALRDDVRQHLDTALRGHYGSEGLGLVREVVVRRESSHRVGNLFS